MVDYLLEGCDYIMHILLGIYHDEQSIITGDRADDMRKLHAVDSLSGRASAS